MAEIVKTEIRDTGLDDRLFPSCLDVSRLAAVGTGEYEVGRSFSVQVKLRQDRMRISDQGNCPAFSVLCVFEPDDLAVKVNLAPA